MQGVLFALVPIFAWGAVGLVANMMTVGTFNSGAPPYC